MNKDSNVYYNFKNVYENNYSLVLIGRRQE